MCLVINGFFSKLLQFSEFFSLVFQCVCFSVAACISLVMLTRYVVHCSSLAVNLRSVTSPEFVRRALLFKESELLRALAARLLSKVRVCVCVCGVCVCVRV